MGTSKKVVLAIMFLTCAIVMSLAACSFMQSDLEVTEPETTEISTVITTESSVKITENSVEVTIEPTETTVKVEEIDTVKPVISGVKDLTCEVGNAVNALDGVSAQDAHDGSVIVSVNEYNTSNVGDFALTYTATDEAGNTETLTAKLTVNAVPVVTEVACDKTMYVTSGTLNIRDAASTDGNKIGSMSYRDSVHVIASVVGSNWVKVEYNGIVGYSSSGYLSDTKPAVSQPTSGTTAGTTQGTTQTDPTQAAEPTQGTTSGGDIPVWTPDAPPVDPNPSHGY